MDAKKRERGSAQKPIRAVIAETDQEILRLLVRRANLLEKIKDKGHVTQKDEKFLRESWQNDVARVSRDPELSGRFFALMQQLTFLPKPGPETGEKLPGSKRRETFNLAPSQQPVQASLQCPLSGWQSAAWLYLACAAGQPVRIAPALQNDALVDLVRCLVRMGGAVSREEGEISARRGDPLGAPDKILHAGADEFCLSLIIAHYAGRPSRVKITGDAPLSLTDLSSLRHFLPEMGCRLINIVPKSATLPIRLEASGLLPASVAPGPQIPASFACSLILAAPFYSAPFAIDLASRPDQAEIFARTVPLLEAAGVTFSIDRAAISIDPGPLAIPAVPDAAMDPGLAVFLLGFAFALGGNVDLLGSWPDWPSAKSLWEFCENNGFKLTGNGVRASFPAPCAKFAAPEKAAFGPFATALAACAVLRGGEARLTSSMLADPDVTDFLRIAGIAAEEGGELQKASPYAGLAWNAPTPEWAMALALAACARIGKSGWPLGNPGIITGFWPQFWQFYNSLPDPRPARKPGAQQARPEPKRRRILTETVAVPPEIREEDWD